MTTPSRCRFLLLSAFASTLSCISLSGAECLDAVKPQVIRYVSSLRKPDGGFRLDGPV